MLKRHLEQNIAMALKDTPVIFLNGARQTGKSTLVESLLQKTAKASYVTFDNPNNLSAAAEDPLNFLQNFSVPVYLDEVQKVPSLFPVIKLLVDKKRIPGSYVLTGSANVLLLPNIAESLAGRMEILTLHGFSQGEIEGQKENFIDILFSKKQIATATLQNSKADILARTIRGGYPELLNKEEQRRATWFASYINAILQRDIRDIANIEGLTQLPKLLTLLSSRISSLLNVADIGTTIGIPQTTLKRYITLLETTFLISFLPAWSTNSGKRLIKTPKLYFYDSGLASYLTGLTGNEAATHRFTGQVVENFILSELRKQSAWSETRPDFFYFRTTKGDEVDIILENRKGEIVGVEVKFSETVTANDFKSLKILSEIAGKNWKRGIVLYSGSQILTFGKDLHAVPISGLWHKW